MKFVIQRVLEASVAVDGEVIGQINEGYMVLIGVGQNDTKEIADKMVKKMVGLRIFEDENGKTNLNLASVGGQILIVSQFTLYADCRKGNRPSFVKAGSPLHAEELYNYLIEKCEELTGIRPQTGEFGAFMKVKLTNNGPFTMLMDSDELGY
jgi:D-tyrosyl-tRNA(Tyr) deacylase